MLALVGRRRHGVSVEQAEAEARTLLPNLRDTLKLGGVTDYEPAIVELKKACERGTAAAAGVIVGAQSA